MEAENLVQSPSASSASPLRGSALNSQPNVLSKEQTNMLYLLMFVREINLLNWHFCTDVLCLPVLGVRSTHRRRPMPGVPHAGRG